jgi:hypothetical protein
MIYGIMAYRVDGELYGKRICFRLICSDPFLMTGFDQKTLHLKNKGNEEWNHYKTIKITPG